MIGAVVGKRYILQLSFSYEGISERLLLLLIILAYLIICKLGNTGFT